MWHVSGHGQGCRWQRGGESGVGSGWVSVFEMYRADVSGLVSGVLPTRVNIPVLTGLCKYSHVELASLSHLSSVLLALSLAHSLSLSLLFSFLSLSRCLQLLSSRVRVKWRLWVPVKQMTFHLRLLSLSLSLTTDINNIRPLQWKDDQPISWLNHSFKFLLLPLSPPLQGIN